MLIAQRHPVKYVLLVRVFPHIKQALNAVCVAVLIKGLLK